MKNILLATASTFALTTAAFAEDNLATPAPVTIGGEIETVIAETGVNDKWGATTSFELNIDVTGAAFGGLNFVVDTNDDVTLDEWHIGTRVGAAAVSFGDQDNIWFETESGATIEEPGMDESLKVSVAGATVALGFTDVTADVTDLSNVQGSYTLNAGIMGVTAVGDYNLDSDEWVAGGRADTAGMLNNVRLGGAVTYGSASEKFGFEADATIMGVTAYLAGDDSDLAQNVGGSYVYTVGSMELEGALDYDIDGEEFTPAVSLTFAF
jgi:hypothetical protein